MPPKEGRTQKREMEWDAWPRTFEGGERPKGSTVGKDEPPRAILPENVNRRSIVLLKRTH